MRGALVAMWLLQHTHPADLLMSVHTAQRDSKMGARSSAAAALALVLALGLLAAAAEGDPAGGAADGAEGQAEEDASEPEQPYRASERAHVAAPGGAGANAELLFQLGFSALSELEGAFQTKGCTFRIKRACVSVRE